MDEYTVTAYPYAVQYGSISVPKGTENVQQYISDHWKEVKFKNPDLDYAGTDFDFEKE